MKKGYTLIEILAVLSILGILFSVGYVSFRDFSRRQVVTSQTRSLKSNLRLAQEQALSGKKPEGCTGSLITYDFTIVNTTSYKSEAVCTGGKVLVKEVTLPGNITITIPPVNPISFKILGQGTNLQQGTSMILELTHTITSYKESVTVSSSGEIQ